VEYAYQSEQYFSQTNSVNEFQDSYGLLHLRAGLRDPDNRWRATAWVTNVTDEEFLVDTRESGFGTLHAAGPPRFYGLELGGSFYSFPDWMTF
jgi:outer membrane receptor protein involved in Fe transport